MNKTPSEGLNPFRRGSFAQAPARRPRASTPLSPRTPLSTHAGGKVLHSHLGRGPARQHGRLAARRPLGRRPQHRRPLARAADAAASAGGHRHGHIVTSAMAEGAIEGSASMYEVPTAHSTRFAFSRFDGKEREPTSVTAFRRALGEGGSER